MAFGKVIAKAVADCPMFAPTSKIHLASSGLSHR
jgi:hypothetical protein